jgi:hypothetical protein
MEAGQVAANTIDLIVPGAHFAKLAEQAFRQGSWVWGIAYTSAALTEAGLAVATLGQSSLATATSRSAATGSALARGATKAAEQGWKLGGFKSAAKWESQMAKRGWTPQQITEAMKKGEKFGAENLVNRGNAATRYVHPETGRSVVVDNVTKEVIHVGGDAFKY